VTWRILEGDCSLAYMAGIIDADGTIGIKRSTYAMRRRGDATQPVFSERVCVKQVTPEAIDLLHETFDGYRFMAGPGSRNGRPMHGWQVTDLKAYGCLLAVRPYLRIKVAQAENCIALREVKERSKRARVAFGRGHAGAAVRPLELTDEMEAFAERAHLLNRVGGDAL